MSKWSDLSKLTEAEKDILLLKCFDAIDRLGVRVKKLEDIIAKNSSNSSKPSSTNVKKLKNVKYLV